LNKSNGDDSLLHENTYIQSLEREFGDLQNQFSNRKYISNLEDEKEIFEIKKEQ